MNLPGETAFKNAHDAAANAIYRNNTQTSMTLKNVIDRELDAYNIIMNRMVAIEDIEDYLSRLPLVVPLLMDEPQDWHAGNHMFYNDQVTLRQPLQCINPQDQNLHLVSQQLFQNMTPDMASADQFVELQDKVHAASTLKLLNKMLLTVHQQLQVHPTHAFASDVNSDMGREWNLRKFWIRCLHLPGFLKQDQNGRFISQHGYFQRIYSFGRQLLERELEITRGQNNIPQQFRWIERSRGIIETALRTMPDAAVCEYNFNSNNLNVVSRLRIGDPGADLIMNYNMTEQPWFVVNEMLRRFNTAIKQHSFERLIIDLLEKENDFENALLTEHVEDKLINKQVPLFNDRTARHNLGLQPYNPMNTIRIQDAIDGKEDPIHGNDGTEFTRARIFLEDIFAGISVINRQRRNFRLMRDWVGGRPWKIICHYYDTNAEENQWRKEAIERFTELGLNGRRGFCGEYAEDEDAITLPRPNHNHEPSSINNVNFHLFGVHPVDYSKILHENSDPRCWLCAPYPGGPIVAGHTVMVLHCGCRFHWNCIMTNWDRPHMVTNRCPRCSSIPKLNHMHTGIDIVEPMVPNVWDWKVPNNVLRDLNVADEAFDLPPERDPEYEGEDDNGDDQNGGLRVGPLNKNSRWWIRENLMGYMFELSYMHAMMPGDSKAPPRNIVSVEVERAWLREARRVQDAKERNAVQRGRQGLFGLHFKS